MLPLSTKQEMLIPGSPVAGVSASRGPPDRVVMPQSSESRLIRRCTRSSRYPKTCFGRFACSLCWRYIICLTQLRPAPRDQLPKKGPDKFLHEPPCALTEAQRPAHCFRLHRRSFRCQQRSCCRQWWHSNSTSPASQIHPLSAQSRNQMPVTQEATTYPGQPCH
jgi:hypothetical protein